MTMESMVRCGAWCAARLSLVAPHFVRALRTQQQRHRQQQCQRQALWSADGVHKVSLMRLGERAAVGLGEGDWDIQFIISNSGTRSQGLR